MAAQMDLNARWERLEALLTAAKPGDTLSAHALLEQTGLPRDTIMTVLTELTRVELFERRAADVFIRRSLWQQTG
jgi:DNA-binding IclR family transcriptional regulator